MRIKNLRAVLYGGAVGVLLGLSYFGVRDLADPLPEPRVAALQFCIWSVADDMLNKGIPGELIRQEIPSIMEWCEEGWEGFVEEMEYE